MHRIRRLIHREARRLLADKYHRVDPRDLFDKLSGKSMVFFDTETTGLDPHDYQVTEIAAIATVGDDFKNKAKYHKKIRLTDKTRKQIEYERENPPQWGIETNLKMTKYEELDLEEDEEYQALLGFKEFCAKNKGILVAHNAKFDLSMIGTKVGRIPNDGVFDTMKFARYFFIPSLVALSENGNEDAIKTLDLMRSKKGKPSSALGSVAKSLGINASSAHSAIADVRMSIGVFRGIVEHFREHPEVVNDPRYMQEHDKAKMTERYFEKKDKQRRIDKRKKWRSER